MARTLLAIGLVLAAVAPAPADDAAAATDDAPAGPVVTSARVERTRRGLTATIRGKISEADWGAATEAEVGIADATATLAPPKLRQAARTRTWRFADRRGDVVRAFVCSFRNGRFTVRCRAPDPAAYADPLAFSLTFERAFRYAIPLDEARRVTVFRGALAPLADDPDPPPPDPARVVAYFASWGVYARGYHVKTAETSGAAARITHLNYAFADIGPDLRVALGDAYADIDRYYDAAASVDGVADTWDAGALRGSFRQIEELKALHPSLKVMISIGGWTYSARFSDAALTAESRAAFVESAIDRFLRGNFAPGVVRPGIFDGIDLDWEWPGAPGSTNNYRPEDGANFTALLAKFRAELDAQGAADGRTYLLTIAAPAGESNIAKIDVASVAPLVDGVNLMSYDLRGGWSPTTGHHAALRAPADDPAPAEHLWVDHAVGLWRAGGAPAAKLTIGVPFYGRGWSGVPAGTAGDGLWQVPAGLAPGTYEAGVEDWHVLTALPASYARHHDPGSGASWLFDASAGVFWSFDDAASLAAKASYVRESALGGVMVWELSGDDRSATLLRGLADALAGTAKR